MSKYSEDKVKADSSARGAPERVKLAPQLNAMSQVKIHRPVEVQGRAKAPEVRTKAKETARANGAAHESMAVARQPVEAEDTSVSQKQEGARKRKQISPPKDRNQSKKVKITDSRQPGPESEEEESGQPKARGSQRPNASSVPRASSGRPVPSSVSLSVAVGASQAAAFQSPAVPSFVELFVELEASFMSSLALHIEGIRSVMEHQAQELQVLRRGAVDIVEQQEVIDKRLGWFQRDAAIRELEPENEDEDEAEHDIYE